MSAGDKRRRRLGLRLDKPDQFRHPLSYSYGFHDEEIYPAPGQALRS